MTISYAGNFFKHLFMWRGSVWKAIWKELLVWLLMFYGLKFGVKYLFGDDNSIIKRIVEVFRQYTTELPIEFMLSFYVNQVITRWMNQIISLPWPDEIMCLIGANIKGSDIDSKLKRHAIGRYLVLTQVLAIRGISTRVRKRFPTLKHVVEAGLMTKEEYDAYERTPTEHIRWQLPLSWAQNIVTKSSGVNNVNIPPTAIVAITNEMNKYRSALRTLFIYDWICFPLVYTQATGIGLYGYFAMCLIGRQYYVSPIDPAIPFLTILKFIFYVGWFKKAQDMMRPFGEDDDDVELNYLLDRHLRVTTGMADFSADQRPALMTAPEMGSLILHHTKWSADIDERPPLLHARLRVKKLKAEELFQTEDEPKDVIKNSTEELLLF